MSFAIVDEKHKVDKVLRGVIEDHTELRERLYYFIIVLRNDI